MPRSPQSSALRSQTGSSSRASPRPGARTWPGLTGFCEITCRKALRTLIAEGTLIPGVSRNARHRVAVSGSQRAGDVGDALSRTLAAFRRAAGLTQPGLAALTGYSVTTVGHAETGRLWQSRTFWQKADLMLAADGELTCRYDAYHAENAHPADIPGQLTRSPPQCVPNLPPWPAWHCTGPTGP